MTTHKHVTAAPKLSPVEERELRKRQNANAALKRKRGKAHSTAYLIHDKLFLTFGQCVHLMLTMDQGKAVEAAMNTANRNIAKLNEADKIRHGSLAVARSYFDYDTFKGLLDKSVAWAS